MENKMKLTKTYLRKIIKEEIKSLSEVLPTIDESKWTVQGRPAKRADAAAELASTDEEDNYVEPDDEHVYPSGLREMDRETLDLYDEAIRLGHERLVGLIEWLKDYRDNPDSARTT